MIATMTDLLNERWRKMEQQRRLAPITGDCSCITVVLNRVLTIEGALAGVRWQNYPLLSHRC